MTQEHPDPAAPPAAEHPSAAPPDVGVALVRIEEHLRGLRDQLDTVMRVRRHREFSVARLVGAILQVVVAGFVFVALADWVFARDVGPILVKLGFAVVLQLAALTAFVLAREPG